MTPTCDADDEGRALAEDAARRWSTRDPLCVALRTGAAITAARWAPVTAGECDRVRGRIVVNDVVVDLTAETPAERAAVRARIVAHELGHLLARTIEDEDERRVGRASARARAERRAHAFAAALLEAADKADVRSTSKDER